MTAQQHGSATTYDSHGCRCADCKAAHSARVTGQRARRKARGAMGEHGSVSTYTNYGCRCEACKQAMRAYRHELGERQSQ